MLRLTFVLSLMMVCTFTAVGNAQKVTIQIHNGSLEDVLSQMARQSGVRIVYDPLIAEKIRFADIAYEQTEMRRVLDEVLHGTGLEYEIVNGAYVVKESLTVRQAPFRTVTGRITDEGSQPIVGVTVVLQNTNRGVITDADGRYSIDVPGDGVLVFSHVTFNTQTIQVEGRAVINLSMMVKYQAVNEVVITGYRVIDQESATGSYATIGEDVLEKKPVTNISHALTGMVAGLATVSSTIDGQDRFLIRGEGTIGMQTSSTTDHEKRLDTDPLIVVDGFPIQGFTPSSVGGGGILNSKDPFSTINPNDVESITVLKDAAATSIYGARAANGVIVITTKKGKAGDKINISVNGFVSASSKPDLDYAFNMASAESQIWFVENLKKYSSEYAGVDPYRDAANPFRPMSDIAALVWETFDAGNMSESEYNSAKAALLAQARGNKWQDDLNKLVYRNSITQQYNLALRGGTDIHTYAFSAGYEDDKTHERGVSTQKIMANFMNSFKLHRRLTLDVGLNAGMTKGRNNGVNLATLRSGLSPWTRLVDGNGDYNHFTTSITYPYASTNGNSSGNLSLATMYMPILESRYADVVPSSWYYNPVEDAKTMNNTTERFNVRLNAGLKYDIVDGLSVAVRGQYERNQYEANMVYSPESYYVRHYNNVHSSLNPATGRYETYYPAGGVLNERGDKFEGYTFRAQADFNRQFGRHRVTAVAGTEVISSTNVLSPTIWRYGYNENTNAVLTSIDYVNQRANIFGAQAYMPYIAPGILATLEDRFFSVYLDTEYTYNNRYILTASLRADASNYQARDVRDKFSPFWSVGGAWLISRENFMQDTDWVNSLKLRASIGESGLAAGKYSTSTVTTVATYAGNILQTNNEPYNTISARGNTTLTWEKSRTFDMALDFRLWDDKLYGSVEYYNKFSYDVLSNATVPLITQGVATAKFNNAELSNKGVELKLGSRMTIAGDLKWDGWLNFSYNKNEVLKYLVTNTSPRPAYYPGYSMNHIWVSKLAGYTDEGYMILQGNDGTQEIVKDRASLHIYDSVNGAAGEKVEDYNWTYALGNNMPSTYASFSSTFTWKGLTLSFLLTGKFDYYFYRGDNFGVSHINAAFSKSLDKALEIYNEGYGNQSSYTYFPLFNDANAAVFATGFTWPYMSNLHNYSQAGYLKGDHIRLNEIYLGYDLPRSIMDRQKVFSNVNVFFQARNLGMIWSANKVMDPDYPAGSFKPMATYTFGLKFNFN